MSYHLSLHLVRCCRLAAEKNTNFFHLKQRNLMLTQVKSVIFSSNFSTFYLLPSLPDYNYNLPGAGKGVYLDVSYLKMEELKPATFSQVCVEGIDEKSSSHQLWLLLYQVQDPMNFGAILCSAYYFGANKVIFSKENSAPINPVVSKSSAGALELLPMAYTEQTLVSLLKKLKKCGWKLLGTVGENCQFEGKCLKHVTDTNLSGPTVLIVGNEGSGVSEQLLDLCDQLVTVPSYVDSDQLHIDSLNVSVATGILLHSLKQTPKTS